MARNGSRRSPLERIKLLPLRDSWGRETLIILWTWRWATELFHNAEYGPKAVRTRGYKPRTVNEMIQHVVEVLIILQRLDLPIKMVVSGILHDVRELYINQSPAQVTKAVRSKLRKYAVELVAGLENWGGVDGQKPQAVRKFSAAFTDEVLLLIAALEEPPKTRELGNWRQRKECVLEKLRLASSEVALLSCVTKISGLLTAVDVHAKGQPTSEWSAGSLEDNIWFFEQLLQIYTQKQVPSKVLKVLEHLFDKFRLGPRKLGRAR